MRGPPKIAGVLGNHPEAIKMAHSCALFVWNLFLVTPHVGPPLLGPGLKKYGSFHISKCTGIWNGHSTIQIESVMHSHLPSDPVEQDLGCIFTDPPQNKKGFRGRCR